MFNFKALISAIIVSFAVAKDQVRLSNFNGATSTSATVTNDSDSYIAKLTFDLIVDTGSSNTWLAPTPVHEQAHGHEKKLERTLAWYLVPSDRCFNFGIGGNDYYS
ncbi:hypothetical protein FIBSPDRAFT_949601 [Athelia psychrophila]|uniref:Peptidase A1 domain-containing protein n=1 Tax=Athelia psychrophila TaxID=1759441 RepID=A0A166PIA4_9AGAM|nr:hypothetical protein FIBSPDRAFT_949601 [Fibularhizoctonia sp. CBS 109695]